VSVLFIVHQDCFKIQTENSGFTNINNKSKNDPYFSRLKTGHFYLGLCEKKLMNLSVNEWTKRKKETHQSPS